MASPGMFAAFACAIIVISMWAGWVVRTHRGGAHVKALPILVLLAVAVFEALAIDILRGIPYDAPGHASPVIARGMRYVAYAWGSVLFAIIWLGVLSLRKPSDPDAPSARVVREPRQDR